MPVDNSNDQNRDEMGADDDGIDEVEVVLGVIGRMVAAQGCDCERTTVSWVDEVGIAHVRFEHDSWCRLLEIRKRHTN